MLIQGIDTSTVSNQFENAVPGRTIIIDGDGPCYVAAATVKRLDTAISRFKSEMLKQMFLAKATSARIHLTASASDKHGRFRVIASQPYQGNRTNKAKPALLEPLRVAVADNSTWLDEYSVMLHTELEADDGMMQDAYLLGENGVIRSDDKDLRMTPYPYYDIAKGQVMASQPEGWVSLACTPSGVSKIVGQGPMFFWGQMIAGDQADHIRGLQTLDGKKCGPAAAFEALGNMKSQAQAANFVIDKYRAIGQNVVAEGWLLWLTRWHKDNVLTYMLSLPLTAANADYVRECSFRDWVKPKEVRDATDTNE